MLTAEYWSERQAQIVTDMGRHRVGSVNYEALERYRCWCKLKQVKQESLTPATSKSKVEPCKPPPASA